LLRSTRHACQSSQFPTNSLGHLLKQHTGSEPPHRMYNQPVFSLIGGYFPAEPHRKRGGPGRLCPATPWDRPQGTALHRATIPQYWCDEAGPPKARKHESIETSTPRELWGSCSLFQCVFVYLCMWCDKCSCVRTRAVCGVTVRGGAASARTECGVCVLARCPRACGVYAVSCCLCAAQRAGRTHSHTGGRERRRREARPTGRWRAREARECRRVVMQANTFSCLFVPSRWCDVVCWPARANPHGRQRSQA
jgi:hypothetical protein